jgi:hypothetical protein
MFIISWPASLQDIPFKPAFFRYMLKLISGFLLLFLAFNIQASNKLSQAAEKIDADMNFRLDKVVEQPTQRTDSNSTADHTKFDDLKVPFKNGPEVTKACLKCHTEAGHQFMKNIHWT